MKRGIMMKKSFKRGLLGGTFDRFHKGHEKLIHHALEKCYFLEIWITSDNIASLKSKNVQSFEERKLFLEKWILNNNKYLQSTRKSDINLQNRILLQRLEDNVGPAEWRTDCDAIICTVETKSACEKINMNRKKSDLIPLNIISVNHFLTEDDKILSSSLIRKGIYNREGKLWIPDYVHSNSFLLPQKVEKNLKKPFGELFEGPEEKPEIAISSFIEKYDVRNLDAKLVAVGDVCVSGLRAAEIIPDIAVVDGMTKRQKISEESKPSFGGYKKISKCKNPAGEITFEFSKCLILAAQSDFKTIIDVQGEEDLAPMILHLALPLDSILIYGQPHKGIVVSKSNEEVKQRCRDRLSELTKVKL
tara:strand:+ start:15092 stop:16174 length:1083 start_codon:yes stop_codon:yes gene_type:complete